MKEIQPQILLNCCGLVFWSYRIIIGLDFPQVVNEIDRNIGQHLVKDINFLLIKKSRQELAA